MRDATPGSEPEVLYRVEGHVATVTLNRPHRRNAISARMLSELTEALEAAESDRAVWAGVLTGAGKASEIAGNAPLAVQAMKRLFRHGLSEDFESHTHHVLLQTMHLFSTSDLREGITAFAQRRAANIEGR